jgi:hypothetical protein
MNSENETYWLKCRDKTNMRGWANQMAKLIFSPNRSSEEPMRIKSKKVKLTP